MKGTFGRKNLYIDKDRYVDIRGKVVRDHTELACLLKDWRNPKRELFHTVYLDTKGKVLAHTAITSDTVNVGPIEMPYKIAQRAKRLNAINIYNAHNHPSGVATPSSADILVTKRMASQIEGFKGHLVLDHDCYSLIYPDGRVQEFKVNLGKSYESAGEEIIMPSQALKVFHHHYQFEEGKIGLLILNSQCKPVALEKIGLHPNTLDTTISQIVRKHRGSSIILGMNESEKLTLLRRGKPIPHAVDIVFRNVNRETYSMRREELSQILTSTEPDVSRVKRVFDRNLMYKKYLQTNNYKTMNDLDEKQKLTEIRAIRERSRTPERSKAKERKPGEREKESTGLAGIWEGIERPVREQMVAYREMREMGIEKDEPEMDMD